MSELDKTTPVPTEIKLHQVSRQLEIAFNNGTRFELPYEFLRVYSPSAEVRGHGIEPVGSYAVTLTFSDGHDTGIYSWDYLYELGANYVALWGRYLSRMEAAGASREPLAGAPERPKAK